MHRLIPGGIDHNLPPETAPTFVKVMVDVDIMHRRGPASAVQRNSLKIDLSTLEQAQMEQGTMEGINYETKTTLPRHDTPRSG
jgi:hypothetical protein